MKRSAQILSTVVVAACLLACGKRESTATTGHPEDDKASQPPADHPADKPRPDPGSPANNTDLGSGVIGDEGIFEIGGGQRIVMKYVPAGKFMMGSPPGKAGRSVDEEQHEVTLTKAFWLGRTEVTQEQWQSVTGDNPSWHKGKDLPVEMVSWKDATEYCAKLNGKGLLPAGWRWTLPSEAQWEYACRAGTKGAWAGDLDDMAWYRKNRINSIHEVATRKPNAWGLFDMHGNVCEWCADWFDDHPMGAATDPVGPDNGSARVIRGGCYHNPGACCRSALRFMREPDFKAFSTGFRVAAVPAGQ